MPCCLQYCALSSVASSRRRRRNSESELSGLPARATIDLLKDTFDDRLISRFGLVNWPSKSYDLKPLDYFLWGYVKSLVYADKPQTLDHLEYNIRRVIADIRPQMLERVIENWTSRLDYIRASRGSPMPEIIFKM
ncbi:transposable element Tc3 transposase [Trichonephila clavipes]|nr:transposable element Tc3 transposase [Trichonephila clavipes]